MQIEQNRLDKKKGPTDKHLEILFKLTIITILC